MVQLVEDSLAGFWVALRVKLVKGVQEVAEVMVVLVEMVVPVRLELALQCNWLPEVPPW
jgi:hypothetical protein